MEGGPETAEGEEGSVRVVSCYTWTTMIRMWHKSILVACVISLGVAVPTVRAQTGDEKLKKRVERIDKVFFRGLAELAKKYEKEKVPEAAHFFAECYVGLAGKEADTSITAIRTSTELGVYLGKARGGESLKDEKPIRKQLVRSKNDYKKLVGDLVEKGKKEELSKEAKEVLYGCVIKYELARGAGECIGDIHT